jgi:hypothetical protein
LNLRRGELGFQRKVQHRPYLSFPNLRVAGVRVVSQVNSRPNYYEMLGLTPSAAGDAIAKAFARATGVFRPHAFGSLTELCVAYETLRDPARRRAYDASLGLAPRPIFQPVTRPASAHFMLQPNVAAAPPAPPPDLQPQPRPAPRIDQAPEPYVAALPPGLANDTAGVDVSPIDWKRTGALVGGLVAAAVLIGAFAGWWSGSNAAEPEPAAQAAAPKPAKAAPTFSDLWSEPGPPAVEAQTARPRVAARPPVERTVRRLQRPATEAEPQLNQPPSDLADAAGTDEVAPETSPAATVAAAMPLPHKTVARTLDRIGYRCGSVASATPVEGSVGVYRVTCTSGHSFQAKPVNGRYRFRRLASN